MYKQFFSIQRSLENFQLIDKESIDNSIVKGDFLKIYQQQGANLNDPDQNVEFNFGENNNYHQTAESSLEFDITVRNSVANFDNTNEKRLINNPYAYCFEEASFATTGGMEIEHVKFLGQISSVMTSITSKDGVLFKDGDANASIKNTTLKEMLIDKHTVAAKKSKIKGQLPFEQKFGFF